MIQYLEMDAAGYRPGVCNIGPAEIRRRRQIGYLGLASAVALVAFLLAADAPTWMRLALAFPVAAGLEGFIQARERFCAGFAMAGLRNMGELGSQVAIEDEHARSADRRKALRIHAIAMAGGLIAGFAFAVLPI